MRDESDSDDAPRQPPVLTMPLIAMVSRCPTIIVAPQNEPS